MYHHLTLDTPKPLISLFETNPPSFNRYELAATKRARFGDEAKGIMICFASSADPD